MSKKYSSVMLVDDNEIDNLINQKMIEASGIAENIYIHTGAKSAIEFLSNIIKIPEIPEKMLPGIIFLDIDMPIMDGFQFLDEFDKIADKMLSQCKVVMLTSSINTNDVDRSKKYPFVKKYIHKPLSKENLEELDI